MTPEPIRPGVLVVALATPSVNPTVADRQRAVRSISRDANLLWPRPGTSRCPGGSPNDGLASGRRRDVFRVVVQVGWNPATCRLSITTRSSVGEEVGMASSQ